MSLAALWKLAGGRAGSCRTPGMNKGSYNEEWEYSETECQGLCEQFSECVATEFSIYGGYTRCELHKVHAG